MPIGALLGGMSVDFADVILIINGFAIAILLGVLYIENIVAGWNRMIRILNPLNIRARFRISLQVRSANSSGLVRCKTRQPEIAPVASTSSLN